MLAFGARMLARLRLELDARSKSSHVGSLRSNCMLAQRARMFSPPAAILDSNWMLAQRARMLARFARTVCSLFELACSRPKGLEPPPNLFSGAFGNPRCSRFARTLNSLRLRGELAKPPPHSPPPFGRRQVRLSRDALYPKAVRAARTVRARRRARARRPLGGLAAARRPS